MRTPPIRPTDQSMKCGAAQTRRKLQCAQNQRSRTPPVRVRTVPNGSGRKTSMCSIRVEDESFVVIDNEYGHQATREE
jgi:hypothetical protein